MAGRALIKPRVVARIPSVVAEGPSPVAAVVESQRRSWGAANLYSSPARSLSPRNAPQRASAHMMSNHDTLRMIWSNPVAAASSKIACARSGWPPVQTIAIDRGGELPYQLPVSGDNADVDAD